jgi:anti-sigma B factor antagonist
MDIQVESSGDCRIVHIKGKVTFEYCAELQSRLDSMLEESVQQVVIDFKEVPFIDSSGVGEVLRLFKRMQDAKGEVILVNPNQKLRDLFSMYRFNQFMTIREQEDLHDDDQSKL